MYYYLEYNKPLKHNSALPFALRINVTTLLALTEFLSIELYERLTKLSISIIKAHSVLWQPSEQLLYKIDLYLVLNPQTQSPQMKVRNKAHWLHELDQCFPTFSGCKAPGLNFSESKSRLKVRPWGEFQNQKSCLHKPRFLARL